MIKEVELLNDYMGFIDSFHIDDSFIDPNIIDKDTKYNLLNKKKDNRHSYIVLKDNKIIGAFILLILEDESYIEVLIGLSKDINAYNEFFTYLKNNYKGYQVDFVFNPKNYLLKDILIKNNAIFDIEQMKMKYNHNKLDISYDIVIPLSERYYKEYIELHEKDTYWTGDKILKALDKFNVYIIVIDNHVIGYIDVTFCYRENEPYDIFIKEEYRNKGFAKKLLAKALYENKGKDMALNVNIDNIPAIKAYKAIGFIECDTPHSLTAHIYEI